MSLQDLIILSEKCEQLEFENKKMREALAIAGLVTESSREEPCRFDHNGNCQEHSWFGLEDYNCPVKELDKCLRELKEGV